jgi:hypothetical protein
MRGRSYIDIDIDAVAAAILVRIGARTTKERVARLAAELPAFAAAIRAPFVVHPLEDWHDDDGDVLWWRLPVCEPPMVSSPISSDWLLETVDGGCVAVTDVGDGAIDKSEIKGPWATHWSPLPDTSQQPRVEPKGGRRG